MLKAVVWSLLLSFASVKVLSQISLFKGQLEFQGIQTGKSVPFWMRANQFGSVPLQGTSGSFVGHVEKTYDSTDEHLIDWTMGLTVRGDAGKNVRGNVIEGYLKARISIFEVGVGRSKETMGIADTSLSSGSFSESGNSLPIPKLEISIPDYYAIPIWDGLFSFKGKVVHGWLGKVPVSYKGATLPVPTYFHQASLYARIGKADWRIQLYGGFNHQVYWGSERITYGSAFDLSFMSEFWKVATGKNWNRSKIGNQLGSIDQGISYESDNNIWYFYHQFIYDIGALAHLTNVGDGLYGLSLANKSFGSSPISVKKVLFEVFVTKNQGGEPSSKFTPSGDENYYNNDFYRTEGWSYKGLAVGNPLITLNGDARKGLPTFPRDAFINNRIVAFNTGAEGKINNIDVTTKFAYSLNFGTYGTSSFGHSLANTREKPTGHFIPANQFSGFIELGKNISNSERVGLALAYDNGMLLYNSGGIILKFSKRW